LNGKLSGAVTSAAKVRCWEQLAADVSAVSGMTRTAEEVKRKWTCMKSHAKTSAATQKRSISKTGGGEMEPPLPLTEQRVIDVIGPVCVDGIAGGIDVAALTVKQPTLDNTSVSGICEICC